MTKTVQLINSGKHSFLKQVGMAAESLGSPLRASLWLAWVCRIPLLSAIASLFAFSSIPQIRDLFLEISGAPSLDLQFWIAFIVYATFFWLLPSYFMARLALGAAHLDAVQASAFCKRLAYLFPIIIVLIEIISVSVGIFLSQYFSPLQNEVSERYLSLGLFVWVTLGLASLSALVIWLVERMKASVRGRSSFLQIFNKPHTKKDEELLYIAAFVFSFCILIITALSPYSISSAFPRALFLPLLFGLWIPPLTLLGVLLPEG